MDDFDFSDYAKITDFTGLSSAVPTLTMEDCNTDECPPIKWTGNYTCPDVSADDWIPVHPTWNPDRTTIPPPSTTAAPTTVTTTPTTTSVPTIAPDSGASYILISTVCLLLSMILAI